MAKEVFNFKNLAIFAVAVMMLSNFGYSQMALPKVDVLIENGIEYQRIKTLRQLLQIPCMQVRYNNRVIPVALLNQSNFHAVDFINGLPEVAYITISFEGRCYYTSGKGCKIIGGGCCKGKKRISNLDDEMITLPSDDMPNDEEIYYNADLQEILIR